MENSDENEDRDVNHAPKPVLDRIDELLREDGYKQPIPGMFVKDLGANWRAWIVVHGFSSMLLIDVGVYNEELHAFHKAASATTRYPCLQRPDTGPPIFTVGLERLIGDDADCTKRITWCIEIKDEDIPHMTSLPVLDAAVADDVVYCLKKKAYPFLAANTTFKAVIDTLQRGEAVPSPSFKFYAPMLMMKIGLGSLVPQYVEKQVKRPLGLSDTHYLEYVDALLKIFPAKSDDNNG